jgi:hypothetical protein
MCIVYVLRGISVITCYHELLILVICARRIDMGKLWAIPKSPAGVRLPEQHISIHYAPQIRQLCPEVLNSRRSLDLCLLQSDFQRVFHLQFPPSFLLRGFLASSQPPLGSPIQLSILQLEISLLIVKTLLYTQISVHFAAKVSARQFPRVLMPGNPKYALVYSFPHGR